MHSVNISDFEIKKRDETKCYLTKDYGDKNLCQLHASTQGTRSVDNAVLYQLIWNDCLLSPQTPSLHSTEEPDLISTGQYRTCVGCRQRSGPLKMLLISPPALKYVKKEEPMKKWLQETILNRGEEKKKSTFGNSRIIALSENRITRKTLDYWYYKH